MKKIISVLLCLTLLFAFAGCSKADDSNTETVNNEEKKQSQTIEMILTPAEYVLYQNIFFNNQADDYVDKEVTKHGIFTMLYDEYSSMTRYYVWGYNDSTKCCDWQWEFVPQDAKNLPNPGSTIDVTGVFAKNDKGLDGYRIENAEITVTSEVKKSSFDIDTTTMSGTLERVQIMNMQAHKDKFDGKTVTVYGRIESPTTVQHPYYDNCFSQEFESSDAVQATGTTVVVSGTYSKGVITDANVNVSNDF